MRPMTAREQVRPRDVRDATRAKPKVRTPAARGGVRVPADHASGYAGRLRARLGRLRGFILFRRPILALTILLVSSGGVMGLVAGGHMARVIDGVQAAIASAGFAVGDITLAGAERTSPAEAYAALGIERGQSIFTADAAEARRRLLDLPWVDDAEVRRALPNTIAIRLVEKRPFALWQEGRTLSVIERSGAVITEVKADAFGTLPLFAGRGAPEAAALFVDAARPYRALSARLETIERVGERRWDLLLTGGVTVRLPEEAWESQLAVLESLIVEEAILERDIEMIDLRYPDNYVFRLHNGDSRPVSRERRA